MSFANSPTNQGGTGGRDGGLLCGYRWANIGAILIAVVSAGFHILASPGNTMSQSVRETESKSSAAQGAWRAQRTRAASRPRGGLRHRDARRIRRAGRRMGIIASRKSGAACCRIVISMAGRLGPAQALRWAWDRVAGVCRPGRAMRLRIAEDLGETPDFSFQQNRTSCPQLASINSSPGHSSSAHHQEARGPPPPPCRHWGVARCWWEAGHRRGFSAR